MFIVGLTGNMGMGKSLVLGELSKLGAAVVDADGIVGELLRDESVLVRLRRVLGDAAFDDNGQLNKQKVADIIFRDESMRITVEDILHPLVFERAGEILSATGLDIGVVEATVIFERGYQGQFKKMIAVYADEEVALARLESAGVNRNDAMRRMLSQMPAKEKAQLADFVIVNNGSKAETVAQVRGAYMKLMELAQA